MYMLTLQAAVATAERRANQNATVEALFELLFRRVTKLALTEMPSINKLRWQNLGGSGPIRVPSSCGSTFSYHAGF